MQVTLKSVESVPFRAGARSREAAGAALGVLEPLQFSIKRCFVHMPSISQGFISLISQNGLKSEDKRN
jgi:hypothetical protein